MNSSQWTLLDDEHALLADDWSAEGENWQATSRVLRGGLRDGVQQITLRAGGLEIDVLPTRGMNIHAARCGDIRFGWNSPVRGPVHPQFVPLHEPSGLGWLDGFDEWFVRCGIESNGAPQFTPEGELQFPLHGRIANRPAHHVTLERSDSGRLRLTGIVDETRFHFSKLRLISTLELDAETPAIAIEDTIENLSDSPATAQLLYHINFGPPLLGAGAEVLVAAEEVAPRTAEAAEELKQWQLFPAPTPGMAERVYFFRPRADQHGFGHAMLISADRTAAAEISFDTSTLPCFTLWKNPTGMSDGYVAGLEPATNYPNPRAFETEQGRVIELPPRAKVVLKSRVSFWVGANRVDAAVGLIEQLAKPAPTLHATAPASWVAP